MRVLVFGDSTTQGFWDTEGGWVARIRKYYDVRQLEDIRNRDEPTIFNLGISGGRSDTILARFDAEVRARDNGEELVIVICTGLNDSYRGGADKFKSTPEQYEKNMRILAEKAKSYAKKVMFVGLAAPDENKTTPVFWKDIYYIRDRVKLFEEIMQKIAADSDIIFVPIFDEFKSRFDAGEVLLADGLHPDNNGHELIYQIVHPKLDKLVNA